MYHHKITLPGKFTAFLITSRQHYFATGENQIHERCKSCPVTVAVRGDSGCVTCAPEQRKRRATCSAVYVSWNIMALENVSIVPRAIEYGAGMPINFLAFWATRIPDSFFCDAASRRRRRRRKGQDEIREGKNDGDTMQQRSAATTRAFLTLAGPGPVKRASWSFCRKSCDQSKNSKISWHHIPM